MPLPLAATLIPAVAQAGMGIYQMYKGAKQADQAQAMQQDYVIPQEIYDTLTTAEIQALEGMPAEQKAQFVQNIERSASQGIGALQDRRAGVAAIPALVQNQNDAYMNLATQDAVARQANIDRLQAARGQMAGYLDKQYDLNVFQPYMAQLESAQSMKGAGMQNIYGALGSGANQVQGYSFLQDIYGQKPTMPITPSEIVLDPVKKQVLQTEQEGLPSPYKK